MATELYTLHPNAPDENKVQEHNLASPSPQPRSLESNSIGGPPLFSLQELVDAGFSAKELKQAGFDLRSLKTAGFNFEQLKEAGFDASAFKSDGYDLSQLKSAGFTAEELKEAGFDFSSLKEIGFDPSALRIAGFDASTFKSNGCSLAEIKRAGFTAKELAFSAVPGENRMQDSAHHCAVEQLIRDRVRSGRIFGQTWREFFAFFAPFGTQNSFWNRLCKTSMIRHIFVHNSKFVDELGKRDLIEESPSALITVSDVDASVNSCALICALLISIPSGLVNQMAESDFYTTLMMNGWGRTEQELCPAPDFTNPSSNCSKEFLSTFHILTMVVLASFYCNIFVLSLVVFYYMCRPAESYNNSSLLTLLEAFTLEARKRIRKERHANGPESEKLPSQPFESSNLESEVFLKASFLAQNEAEEQKNSEFYMWYKSETQSVDVVLALIVNEAMNCTCLQNLPLCPHITSSHL